MIYYGPKVHISWGELFDKYSILQIKKEQIEDEEKVKNVEIELEAIEDNVNNYMDVVEDLYEELYDTNLMLWNLEDNIRECEKKKKFGEEFIALARAIYMTNDARAHIKRQINEMLGGSLIEEKSYKEY